MTELIKYEAARIAINEACAVDEVLDIKNKHEAMRLYAKQTKNIEMANQCAEIRIRAERRLGQMLKQQKEDGLMNTGAKGLPGNENSLVQSHDETTPKLSDIGISKSMSSRAQAIANVPDQEFEETITKFRDDQDELTSAAIRNLSNNVHVSNNSGENEWYTPYCYIESARLVMGSIDTDPASSDLANQTVKAGRYYTLHDSGLEKLWDGNVWLNPPYAQPLISQFIDRLIANMNTFDQCCMLVNNATDTKWFQLLLAHCDLICFVKGRIKFIDKHGKPSGSPLQGQAIFYFGDNKEGFLTEFSCYGVVL